MRSGFLITGLIAWFSLTAIAQDNTADSNKTEPVSIVAPDKPAGEKTGKIAIDSSGITDMGVAVAPSLMNFRTTPGKSETRYLTRLQLFFSVVPHL